MDTVIKTCKLPGLKATALKGLNKYQQAIIYFDKLYLQDTSNMNHIIELADCYQSPGEYKKSQELSSRTLNLNPFNNYLTQHPANAYLRDTMNADLCYTPGLSCNYLIYTKLGIKYLNRTIDLVTPAPEFLSRIHQDLAAAYYDYVERRIKEIKEELFWEGEKQNKGRIKK
jgi:tetratricopeptide (TPR) repeat protein